MDLTGLALVRATMTHAGVDRAAIEGFERNYRRLATGDTGFVPEGEIDPLDMPAVSDQRVSDAEGVAALATTIVIKLNGGLGTSMGLDRAKSLLPARDGLTFLDIIARQVLALRRSYGVALPLTVLNSFRTADDTMGALAAYPDLASPLAPLQLIQNRVPKLRSDDLTPVRWPADPSLEWCPPGHGDLYTVLYSAGVLDALLDAGFTQAFVSNSDNLGALPDPHVAGWFAHSGAPFAIEAVRRTANDRKGGHFAVRKRDGRIILRETAQTLPEDQAALANLERHRFTSTNNLWFDLPAMRSMLAARGGSLDLPLIKNLKTVDPSDPDSPQVIQLETAMGAAIEVFDGAQTVEVGRDRFIPVKTTSDLLLLRSDCYALDDHYRLRQCCRQLPVVDLGPAYQLIDQFEQRFAHGTPSLVEAASLAIRGDWTFGEGIRVIGHATLGSGTGTIPPRTVLTGHRP